ncbi:MAG: DNA repair protein RadC [Holosporales bacterium]|jgi:DNA repair protein RadC|nr:DNA repair protein RadC [Holosporales bacterium]
MTPIDKKKYYEGHRNRLREKFKTLGRQSLTDFEILELFLFHLIPYKDTKPIAKQLLLTFGTFDGIAMAEEKNLYKIDGVGPSTALALNILGEIFIRRSKQKIVKKPLLNSWDAVIDYCKISDGYKTKENVHVLFLNKKLRLIADEILFAGTVDETPFYNREVLKRALELNAVSIIVIHNHPSGNTAPSSADIEQTKQLFHAAKAIGINLCDHLIVSKSSYTSLKNLGVFEGTAPLTLKH